jgi:hypothetical protein
MRQRGRKPLGLVTLTPARPAPPPAELSDAQAQVWRDVAASMASNWMTRAAQPVLVAFCRHVCRARLLELQIAAFEVEWTRVEGGLQRLNLLLQMAERETRAITACGRALRLTPSTQLDARTAARRVLDVPDTGLRPWD